MAGGSLLGSIATTLTGDRFGRRDSLAIGCVIWVIGCILMAAVQNVAMLIVSRMLNGFAVGMFSCQAYVLSLMSVWCKSNKADATSTALFTLPRSVSPRGVDD